MDRMLAYKIVSYVLLPFGAVMGLGTLMALMIALGNPALLFSVFLSASCVIYIFASFKFLQRGILKRDSFKQSFKDLIKVNGYVALFFSILGLMQGVLILFNHDVGKMILDNMAQMQQTNPEAADTLTMKKLMTAIMYVVVFFTALLIFHITTTLKFLNRFHFLFNRT